MSGSSWKELIYQQAVDGAALANSAVATSLLPAPKIALLPNFWDKLGKKLIFRAAGRISTLVAGPGTLAFDLRFGGTVIWAGGAINLNTVAQVNASWELYVELVLRAIGANANLLGVGRWASRALIGSAAVGAGGVGSIVLPDTAPAVGNNFDSTAQVTVDLFGTWSVANAANSILCHDSSLEAAN